MFYSEKVAGIGENIWENYIEGKEVDNKIESDNTLDDLGHKIIWEEIEFEF